MCTKSIAKNGLKLRKYAQIRESIVILIFLAVIMADVLLKHDIF